MKDSLGDRMKSYYEDRTRYYLPRRTYTIIRVDGKAFHTYTLGLERPFDMGLVEDMDTTAMYLCNNIQGAKFAFVQSDEISILLTDFDNINTAAWFDGNIQKMVSIASSLATSEFNKLRYIRQFNNLDVDINECGETALYMTIGGLFETKTAAFDARVFTIPSKPEVGNYFLWRQQDATRNSISSVAQSLYSHSELMNKNSDQQQEMIFQKGVNWNDFDPKLKRGRFIDKVEYDLETSEGTTKRTKWVSIECPIFSQGWDFLYDKIPEI